MWRAKSEIRKCDVRYKIVKHNDGVLGAVRDLEIEDLYEDVAALNLSSAVPAEVARQYDVARNAYVYSWFEYELATLAEEHAFAVLEMAIKRRANDAANGPSLRGGLTICFNYALSQGWFQECDFRYFRGKIEHSLLKEIVSSRNDLAHGDFHLSPQFALEVLKLTHQLLNKLFDPSQ